MTQSIKVHDQAVSEYWSEQPETVLFIKKMEMEESWVLDGEMDSLSDIEVWAGSLTAAKISEIYERGESLLVILGLMKSSRAFYLLKQLSEIVPSLMNNLTTLSMRYKKHPKYGRYATIFLERMHASEIQNSLKVIFDIDRLGILYHAISTVKKEKGGIV